STSAGACYPPPTVFARCQDVTVPTDTFTCSAAAPPLDAGSSDQPGAAVSLAQAPPAPYALGTTQVTLSVSSTASGAATCTGNVTVVDRTPPILTPPPDVTVTVDDTPVLGTPTTMDACPGVVTVTN